MHRDYSGKSALLTIYAISALPLLFVLYLLVVQIKDVNDIKEQALSQTIHNMANATQLAELERNLGYVGFIHHFKNYIIRRDIDFYARAQKSHSLATKALNELRQSLSLSEDISSLDIIDKTLQNYFSMLVFARDNIAILDVQTLDQQVKISDLAAEQALIILRKNIQTRGSTYQASTANQIENIQQNTIYIGLVIIPFLLVSTWLTARSVKHLSTSSTELATIFNASPDAILYVENDGTILKANTAAYKIFGYLENELLGLKVEMLVEPEIRAKHVKYRTSFTDKEQSREMGDRKNQIIGLKKDGTKVELNISIASKVIEGNNRSICVVKDITQHKKLEQKAFNDHLTSISNRRHFDSILAKELKRFDREETPLSLLMIDIDDFKSLNDQFGHTAGDEALIAVAQFLQHHTREYDHLARWGGDEFVLLCPNLSANDALNKAERIKEEFLTINFPWHFDMSLSIGVATNHPSSPMTAKSFIEEADKAVYIAKDAGKNRCIHFNDKKGILVN